MRSLRFSTLKNKGFSLVMPSTVDVSVQLPPRPLLDAKLTAVDSKGLKEQHA